VFLAILAAAFVNWFVLWISGTIQEHDRQEKEIRELLRTR
jgi:TnpA family transposase